MGAYHNALREEGSRDDLMKALEEAWDEIETLKERVAQRQRESEMTDVKHTPGPWVVVNNRGFFSVEYRPELKVCRTYGNSLADGEDARLIATAPALLSALEFYADRRSYVSYPGDNDTAPIEQDEGERARAAIAAARGER